MRNSSFQMVITSCRRPRYKHAFCVFPSIALWLFVIVFLTCPFLQLLPIFIACPFFFHSFSLSIFSAACSEHPWNNRLPTLCNSTCSVLTASPDTLCLICNSSTLKCVPSNLFHILLWKSSVLPIFHQHLVDKMDVTPSSVTSLELFPRWCQRFLNCFCDKIKFIPLRPAFVWTRFPCKTSSKDCSQTQSLHIEMFPDLRCRG